MPHRPLVLASVLILGDYLLWNWSLSANQDVLALVSGLTLPPLALAWLWLLALTLARAIGHGGRHTRGAERNHERRTRAARTRSAGTTAGNSMRETQAPASTTSPTSSSGKLAA